MSEGNWIRTCQECGHVQKSRMPPKDKELSNAYRNAKCRKCKSVALDYGKMAQIVTPQDLDYLA